MPNFDEETMEDWRQERIHEKLTTKDIQNLAKNLKGYSQKDKEWSIRTMISTIKEDLRKEEINLEYYLAEVKASKAAVKNLKDKLDKIQKLAEEL
jgi:hypothetical protein